MKQQGPSKEVVSVTDMSRMCGLSRARFYQLTKEGIFPPPSRNEQTMRPYFDRDGQEACLTVRRTNRGTNGKAILFYSQRSDRRMSPPKPATRNGKRSNKLDSSSARHGDSEPIVSELRHGLQQLGMTDLDNRNIREAITKAYPDGHKNVDSAELLRSVFEEIQRRDSQDKQCG